MTKIEFNQSKKNAGYKAAEFIKDGMILGLGTGSTAYYALIRAGELVKGGYQLKGVASSEGTARIAAENGVEVVDINTVDRIDLVIDGVDEIDPQFNAIKGGGGALFREKIIAAMATEVIWIMDSSKRVDAIGAFPLPVEILRYGYTHTLCQLQAFGFDPKLREKDGQIYVTDNGNYIADLKLSAPLDIQDVEQKLSRIITVVAHGLFLNMCHKIVVGTDTSAEVINNPHR